MSDRVYVPGYGYVGGEDNTGSARGTGGSRPSVAPPGRERRTWFGTEAVRRARENAATVDGSQRGKYVDPDESPSEDPPKVRADLKLPITYRPPVSMWRTADRQEQEVRTLPLLYRIQDAGDLREAYWGDPESRAIIQAAARIYYRDYSNYNDQWAEGWWQKDIMGAAQNPGAVPPWEMLQLIFTEGAKAESAPDGSGPSTSYGGGGGGGYSYGGGGGDGQVSLTNPTSAKGLLMQTMQQALGRNPTQKEYSQFLKILNEAEMANPQTVSVEGDTVVASGGIDPGVLALEFAQDQDDWQERQNDQYFQVFMQSLAGGA
jgi:hypothetical protein